MRRRLNLLVAPVLMAKTRRRVKMAVMDLRSFAVFAFIGLISFSVGNWIIETFNVDQTGGLLGQLLAFLIPVGIFYYIWVRYGQKAAQRL